jgi:hypothetical protein
MDHIEADTTQYHISQHARSREDDRSRGDEDTALEGSLACSPVNPHERDGNGKVWLRPIEWRTWI